MGTGITPSGAPNSETSAIVSEAGISGSPGPGIVMGGSTSDLIAFYGGTPVAKRTTTALTALSTTTSLTSSQANSLISMVNEIIATLTGNGMHG